MFVISEVEGLFEFLVFLLEHLVGFLDLCIPLLEGFDFFILLHDSLDGCVFELFDYVAELDVLLYHILHGELSARLVQLAGVL
jgi:hypothetical protein